MSVQADQPETASPEPADDDGQAADVTAPETAAGHDDPDVDALKAKIDENWEKYLRAAAELENVRKRAARDVENARKYALERFCGELLDVRDSLEIGLAAADEADEHALREGSEATLKQLSSTMERFGVVEVDPEGEPFDPERHEAMTVQPSSEVEPGSVLTVVQKGYLLNGRLLRPARVVVASEAPSTAENGRKPADSGTSDA